MISTVPALVCAALLALSPASVALRAKPVRTRAVAGIASEDDQDAAVALGALRMQRRLMVRLSFLKCSHSL
jgi:hypothetical protein